MFCVFFFRLKLFFLMFFLSGGFCWFVFCNLFLSGCFCFAFFSFFLSGCLVGRLVVYRSVYWSAYAWCMVGFWLVFMVSLCWCSLIALLSAVLDGVWSVCVWIFAQSSCLEEVKKADLRSFY